MSYGYAPPPGYDQSGPPGMRPPPGMAAPPGMAGSPSAMPPAQYPPPANLPPNLNFNAPVIRLGVDGQPKPSTPVDRSGAGPGGRGSNNEPLGRSRMGLGAERADHGGRDLNAQRQAIRDGMAATTPPTREEVARTIFIGGLGDGAPDDEKIEDLLRCAGKLRRWTRARDADERKCKFGFAEYEDVGSLEAANELFSPFIEVPVFGKGGAVVKEEDDEDTKKMKLLVVVDDQSRKYIDEWKGKQKEDENARQNRIDGCREELTSCLTNMVNEGTFAANAINGDANGETDGDTKMVETNGTIPDAITISLTLEDELSDIPVDMRATVAGEIRAFRDRSTRRDIERLRQEEDMAAVPRANRLGSPLTGPTGSVNGIPVGPRERGVQGAPSGPKGYRGTQMPSDYVNGVNFVSANGANGAHINQEDEDAEESDDELERRRQAARDAKVERQYADAEKRWANRERTRGAALQREKDRVASVTRQQELHKDAVATRFREWDDEDEASRGKEEYYRDRSAWLRARAAFREHEQREDDRDRVAEDREKLDERRREAEAKGMADDFLNQMDAEVGAKAAEQEAQQKAALPGFKISLGSAAQSAAKSNRQAPRRAMAEVENLLEDEDDVENATTKRPELRPLPEVSGAPLSSDMTEAERADAKRALAASIPSSAEELFAYPVKFNYLTPVILEEQVKPFVEKRVVESLGVQEELLVDAVVDALKAKREARQVVGELEDALEDEAEGLVRKVWRMVVFLTESEGRGLN